MHPYGQYCPVARAAEVLADRWTLLIVRELLADVRHFNELERGLPHMSRTLLAERLRRLEQMRVLERRATSRRVIAIQQLLIRVSDSTDVRAPAATYRS